MATATSDNIIDFGSAGSAWGTATHYSLWRAANFVGATPLTTNRAIANGAAVTFPAGDLTIQSPEGEFSPYGSTQALAGAMGTGSILVGLHTGAPGAAGTANEVSGTGYAKESVATSAFSVADDIDFGVAGSPWGRATHYSVWRGDTFVMAPELRVLVNGSFEPLEIAEGARVRFPARGLKIPLMAGTPALVFDIRLHTDAPGADGLANEVDGDGYERTTIMVAPFPVAVD